MKFLTYIFTALMLVPGLAAAQSVDTGYFDGAVQAALDFINLLIPFIFALAFLIFLWGVFTYFILGAGDETKRETGKTYMIYGIVGFVVMVAVWGIVNVLVSLFGFSGDETLNIPDTPVR